MVRGKKGMCIIPRKSCGVSPEKKAELQSSKGILGNVKIVFLSRGNTTKTKREEKLARLRKRKPGSGLITDPLNKDERRNDPRALPL